MMTTGNTTLDIVLNWFKTLVVGFTTASEYVTQAVFNFDGTPISVLTICTFGGITTFLAIAVVKWVIS